MQSEIQTANIVKILRFAQNDMSEKLKMTNLRFSKRQVREVENDKSEMLRMTLENYDRPAVF